MHTVCISQLFNSSKLHEAVVSVLPGAHKSQSQRKVIQVMTLFKGIWYWLSDGSLSLNTSCLMHRGHVLMHKLFPSLPHAHNNMTIQFDQNVISTEILYSQF